jgi:hypothetical protein
MSQRTLTIHFITHRSYILLNLRFFLQLFVVISVLFFCCSIWCVILAFVVRTYKRGNVRINEILRRVRVTVVLHILNVCVCVCVCVYIYICSLSCPECKTHALCYIFVCVLSGSTTFLPLYLINGTVFVEMFWDVKCMFWFSVQLLRKLSHSKKKFHGILP